MAIILNVSHSLEPLVVRLSDAFASGRRDPFVPEWIVTQTEGMNIWIRQQLAHRLGIASNIRFCSPDDVVTGLHFQIAPGSRAPLDRETLRWGIYALLGEAAFTDRFAEISSYYEGNDIKRISLADELADLFDQYQVYRADTIDGWNQAWQAKEEPADWQGWIWARIRTLFHETHMDRVETSGHIVNALGDGAIRASVCKRMPSLHVFGIAIITPYYLRIFRALSQFIDIHLYLVNPAPEKLWLEDFSERQITRLLEKNGKDRVHPAYLTVGNDLLLNWGRIIRESFRLLFADDDLINIYDPIAVAVEAGGTPTLLQKVQRDIRENHNRGERLPLSAEEWKDGSITINGCYTPLREVEVLYNHLVSLVDRRTDRISARDILVMVSDIDLYAPLVRAVFEHAPYAFPFTIADQTLTSGNNIFTALQDLLSIDDDRLKAEDVMELLESPYIRKRFGITDTDALRTAVRQAGIIYSLDGREADDTRMVSWNYGLKKLLYGLCMSGSEPFHDGRDEVIPLDTDEGPSALERVRLIHFMRILQEKLEARKTRRTIAGWADHLRELMEDMVFQAGEQDDEDHPRFIDLIEQLATLDENMSLEVDFEVFRHSFLHRLSLERKSQNFLGAGITFCSLVPMRSIPFRVVAMLGMNFDKFPRKETPVSFSLITRDPRPGDRNVRNNDRHLFLETLLSARESLYISYIAKSEKDAEDIPPASLVDELIDYAAQGMEVDTDKLRQQWITIHPLHGFGKLYFGPGAPANYLSEDRYRTRIEVRPKDPTPPESPAAVLDLETLVQFLQNPPKFNLNRRFNVYYRDEELLLPEHEVFELQSFESWQVRKDIIELEPNALNEYARQKVRTGGLPLSNMGRASVRRTYEELETMRADVMSARAGLQPDSVAIDLAFGDIRLTGKVDGLYGNRLVEPCHSSDHYRHLLAAWLRYLALRAMGVTAEFAFIKNKMKGIHLVPADKVSTEQALHMLADCIEYYRQGLAGHFHFFPALAMNNFKMLTGDHAFFLGQYELELENRMSFKFNDPYLRKAIEQGFFAAENYAALHANTHAIMGPIRELMPELFPGKG